MPTLQRRLLSLLRIFGGHVTDVRPGTVMLSRSDNTRTAPAGPGALLVGDAKGVEVTSLSKGAALVTHRRDMRRDMLGFQKRLHDYVAVEHIAWILRKYKVNCVLDVGGNLGQFAKSIRRAGYTGRIASFEPLPEFVERLERASEDDPEWRVYPYALGRDDGTITMNVVAGSMSSALPPSEFGRKRYKRFTNIDALEVPVRRLDGLLDEVLDGIDAPRPYLKLDTQGLDLEVFAGIEKRVDDLVGIQSEVALVEIYEGMTRMPEAMRTYEAAGFEVTGLYPVSREDRTGRVLEFDCVMVRPDAVDDFG